jgi:hypothetical protein
MERHSESRGSVRGGIDIRMHDAEIASRMSPDEWARIVAFRDLPDFLDGVRRHGGIMAPFFGQNLLLNKVVAEVWRFQMVVFTLYLHVTRDRLDPLTGLTLANMQKICARMQLASPGRVYAFLNIMKLGGYLKSVRSELDSRVVHLEPTPHFNTTVEEWNTGIFASIDAADPQAGMLATQAQFPEIGEYMRTSGAEGLLAGWLPLDPFPEVFHFAAADGGWLLMEYLVGEAIRHPGPPRLDPINLNLRKTGGQFGGSRSNLRRLLERGYELGLLDSPPKGGAHIILSTRMLCSFLTFLASFLGYFRVHSAIGLERIKAGVPPGRDMQ